MYYHYVEAASFRLRGNLAVCRHSSRVPQTDRPCPRGTDPRFLGARSERQTTDSKDNVRPQWGDDRLFQIRRLVTLLQRPARGAATESDKNRGTGVESRGDQL